MEKMAKPLDYLLKHQQKDDWLIGYSSQLLEEIASKLYSELLELKQSSKKQTSPKIILAERIPVRFLASFLAAVAADCPIFLCNPDWGEQELQEVFNLVQPDLVWGIAPERNITWSSPNTNSTYNLQETVSQTIMIPTGGSSGKIKFTIHTWETLLASVQGLTEYFQIETINSFCVLPLYHVSGLMQFMRSLTTGGKLLLLDFKQLAPDRLPEVDPSEYFISLVPTQLQRLLEKRQLVKWLTQFMTVFLGGAPAWEELLEKARFYQIRLAPTYGMTETASQIATLKPDDFLMGRSGSGQILPHAQVKICDQAGENIPEHVSGNLVIQAKSLALGYYPNFWEHQGYLVVDDIGLIDAEGYLHVIGRNSDKIITGGENVYPVEIESAINKTHLVTDICIIGVPDPQWGQVITAIYVPKNPHVSISEIQARLKQQLSKYKIPKYWIPVKELPRNDRGKINHLELQEIARKFLLNPN
jgi:O-succinylbenzoic acid--CoA ligase